jgi:hypothetical protein
MKLFDAGMCHHSMLNKLKGILKIWEGSSFIACPRHADHLFDTLSSGYAELRSRIKTVPDELKDEWGTMLEIYKQKMKLIQI